MPGGAPNGLLVDPVVSFISPAPGTETGTLPTIEARITVGDFTLPQASLDALQAHMDGTDVKGSLVVRTVFGEPQASIVLVTTNLTFQPSAPLTPGPHEFTLEVPVQAYSGTRPGKTIASLTFTVADTPPPPTTQTLGTIKDALVYEKSLHSNEGANPRLTLEKSTERRLAICSASTSPKSTPMP